MLKKAFALSLVSTMLLASVSCGNPNQKTTAIYRTDYSLGNRISNNVSKIMNEAKTTVENDVAYNGTYNNRLNTYDNNTYNTAMNNKYRVSPATYSKTARDTMPQYAAGTTYQNPSYSTTGYRAKTAASIVGTQKTVQAPNVSTTNYMNNKTTVPRATRTMDNVTVERNATKVGVNNPTYSTNLNNNNVRNRMTTNMNAVNKTAYNNAVVNKNATDNVLNTANNMLDNSLAVTPNAVAPLYSNTVTNMGAQNIANKHYTTNVDTYNTRNTVSKYSNTPINTNLGYNTPYVSPIIMA